MKKYFIVASTVAFFPLMAVINSWFFQNYLESSYADWYIKNGALVSIVASLFAVVSKNINSNEGLISANPAIFLAANWRLIGSNLQVIGFILEETGSHAKEYGAALQNDRSKRLHLISLISELFDGITGLVSTLLIVFALSVWFLAIVPFQYFIVLVAGAPARLALKHKKRMTGSDNEIKNSSKDSAKFDEWINNFLSAPVSFTNAVAALVILLVKLTLGTV